MKKRFLRKKAKIFAIICILMTFIALSNNSSAKAIGVVNDGLFYNSSTSYKINSFPGDYIYYYLQDWDVLVNGEKVGQSAFLAPQGEYSSKGRNFVHRDTLYDWGKAMGGNPDYVYRNTSPREITRNSDSFPFYRYYVRDIAANAGAHIGVNGTNSYKYVYVKPTSFPYAHISAPPEVIVGEPFDVLFSGVEYEPYQSDRFKWEIYVGDTVKASGEEFVNNLYNQKESITINEEGTFTIYLTVTDVIERTSKSFESAIIAKTELLNPVEAPTPVEPMPDPMNEPPAAIITSNTSVKAGERLEVSGEESYDNGGKITSYSWSATGTLFSAYSGYSGEVVFANEGYESVYLTVTDNDGATGSAVQQINVLPPTPEADLKVGEGSVQKVNRKVILDASGSLSPEYYPITWEEVIWNIVPVQGQAAESIKVSGSLIGDSKKELLFKSVGRYAASVEVSNGTGEKDEFSILIDITPDLAPETNYSIINKTYRDVSLLGENNEILAKTTINNLSKSIDDDYIKGVIYRAVYDWNNDGVYGEDAIVIDSQAIAKNTKISYMTKDSKLVYVQMDEFLNLTFYAPDVGRWKFEMVAIEGFGQPTIPALITSDDYMRSDTRAKPINEKIFFIDNQAPIAEWGY